MVDYKVSGSHFNIRKRHKEAYLQRETKGLHHHAIRVSRHREGTLQIPSDAVVEPAQLADAQHCVPDRRVQLQRRVQQVALRAGVELDVLAGDALSRGVCRYKFMS